MMACLLTEIRTNQAKADANLKEMMEEITASQELLKKEMLAKLNAHHERMTARMEAVVDGFDKRLDKMDTTVLEANEEKIGDCSRAAGRL